MSTVSLKWAGLEELRAQLRALPAELAAEASRIVLDSAEAARSEIDAGYPEVSGNLKRGLIVKRAAAGPYGAGAVLTNRAKHAWLYDNGTQARHYVTQAGKTHPTGRMWGKSAPTHLFVKTVIRKRRLMYERLKGLLQRHGLTVSGDAG